MMNKLAWVGVVFEAKRYDTPWRTDADTADALYRVTHQVVD